MQYLERNKFLSGRFFPVLARVRLLLIAAFIAGGAAGAVINGKLPARKYSARAVLRCWHGNTETEKKDISAASAVSHKQLADFIEKDFFRFNMHKMQSAVSPDFASSPVTYKVKAGKLPGDIIVSSFGSNANTVSLSLALFTKVLIRSTEKSQAPWSKDLSWLVWQQEEPKLSLTGYLIAFSLIICGGCAGLLLALAITFYYCCTDKSICNIRQFEDECKLPVLGVLPQTAFTDGDDGMQNLSRIYRDAVCSLRDRLNWLLPKKSTGAILQVTGLEDSGGVSYAASALALVWAKQNKRVLLVETDYRSRQRSCFFKISGNTGLGSVVNDQADWHDLLIRNIDNLPLDVLVRGSLNIPPADLLRSRAFENFLQDAAGEYDIVLLDAPPFLLYSDAMILGHLADTTLLICNYRNCSCEKMKLALWRMHKAEINICGWVIDFFPLSKRRNYYYNYQYNFYQYRNR